MLVQQLELELGAQKEGSNITPRVFVSVSAVPVEILSMKTPSNKIEINRENVRSIFAWANATNQAACLGLDRERSIEIRSDFGVCHSGLIRISSFVIRHFRKDRLSPSRRVTPSLSRRSSSGMTIRRLVPSAWRNSLAVAEP